MLGIIIAVAFTGALFIVINEGSRLARPGSWAARCRCAVLELFGRSAYADQPRPWLRAEDPMEPVPEEPTLRPVPIPVPRDEAETLARAAAWPLSSLADEISSVRDLRWNDELTERMRRHHHPHPVAPPRARLMAFIDDPLDEDTHPRMAM